LSATLHVHLHFLHHLKGQTIDYVGLAMAACASWIIGIGPGEPLVDTLRTWLANHGGWDRTAAALGVHRNSVRHRIARVERHLGVDLADPETRMELWFALRWSR